MVLRQDRTRRDSQANVSKYAHGQWTFAELGVTGSAVHSTQIGGQSEAAVGTSMYSFDIWAMCIAMYSSEVFLVVRPI